MIQKVWEREIERDKTGIEKLTEREQIREIKSEREK